jgi:nicotinamide-nucleotide amidase
MRAEIIAIGDELITGQRLDTNSQWLAERLTEIGVEVAFHTTIGDVLADNIAAFAAAMNRTDAIIITGGLGPTADDLTREALARALGVGLVRDEPSLAHIQALFAGRGREMPPQNAVQADLPAGAAAISNEHGTAPGIAATIERIGAPPALIFALPGVPAEMKPMWRDSVAPAIRTALGAQRTIRHRRIKCFGVGESQLEAMLPDLIRRGREPSVGITVSDATITLRITAAGADDAECLAAIEPTIAMIHEALHDIAYGEEDDELEHVVVRLLRERGQTLAVAEWATGGLIEHWISRVDGASEVFAGGITVATLAQLRSFLGATIEANAPPDGSAVATAAAEAIRRATGADYGLAVAAFPAHPDRPDAYVHVAIAAPDRTRRLRFLCATHPDIRTARTAKQALNALRLIILGALQQEVL